MTTRANTACLFGGALLAAGIATSDANADGFAFALTSGVISGDRAVGNDLSLQPSSNTIPGFAVAAYGVGDFYGSTQATTHELSFVHERGASGTFVESYVGVGAYAYVLTQSTLNIAWEFGAWDTTTCVVLDATNNATVFDAGLASSGETSVVLEPGVKYLLLASTRGAAAGGDAFGRFTFNETCPADINGDGVLNFDDIDAFVNSFLGGCP